MSYSKLSEKFKNGIKTQVAQAVLELLIKHHFDYFDP